jgi:hypothetical protein
MLGGKNEVPLQEAAKIKTHLPDRFWEMTPKDAALALVEANCPVEFRQKLQFALWTTEHLRQLTDSSKESISTN